MPTSLPRYEEARLGILGMIEAELQPGDLLPPQTALAEQFGASLITIKRAILELAREDIVEAVRGRGTVVKRKSVRDRRQGVSSWTDSLAGVGEQPSTAWRQLERVQPDERIRCLLTLPSRQPVVRIERLRLANAAPLCLMTNILPAAAVPGLEREGLDHESLYQCLRERYGLELIAATERVTARKATRDEKQHLGRDTQIVLEIERVSRDAADRPLEWAQVIARADRYTYETDLINPTAHKP
ncbi:MAG: GntR family transcriptional regulator [Opitutales bacterium]